VAKSTETFASYITPPLVIPLLIAAIIAARVIHVWS
jgi:hypothetical protein